MRNIYILISMLLLTTNTYAATCATLDCVINQLVPHIEGFNPLIEGIAYLSGIAFGIKGVLKLKEVSETKGQVKLSIPIVLLVASAMCLSFPTLIHRGAETLSLTTSVMPSNY